MKLFYLPTAAVVGLFISNIMIIRCHYKITNYENKLNEEEKLHYEKIKNTRINYYILGSLLSIFIVFFYMWKTGFHYHSIVNSLFILLLLPMIVYMVIPKKNYMLLYSEHDAKEWFEIYLCMKNSMIYGFLFGFILSLGFLYLTDRFLER
jgi:cell division protein FtsW (lipid II flippase)